MNIKAMLKALLIHAPSSKPIPRWPFRSASPSEIMRPVSVTIPAPMITPRIPSNGLFESSEGATAASPCATCSGGGKRTAEVAADIERNLDGDSLHHFRVVAGGIVGRQQRELRTAGGGDFQHLAVKHLARIFIHGNLRNVANLHVGELRFA